MKKVSIEILSDDSTFSLREICERCDLAAERIVEFVEYGVVEPQGDHYSDWQFTPHQLFRLRRALRIQRDLGVNPPGLALALQLLEEAEGLRAELASLKEQRFSGSEAQH